MKLALIAGLAVLATPALAQTSGQTAPPPTDRTTQMDPATQADMSTPATDQVPNTELSTAPAPSDGPRAQQGNTPANSAASANTSDLATSPMTAQPEAPLENYPICKANQFDNCMEPGNRGTSTKRRMRRPR